MTMNSNSLDEALLFNSFREVMKIWTRGFGSASFEVQVSNRSVELSMSFSLGHSTSQHSVSQHAPFATKCSADDNGLKKKKKTQKSIS